MNSPGDLSSREGITKAPEYNLESPFLDRFEPEKVEESEDALLTSSVWRQSESPFVSQLEMESFEGENPQAGLYAQLLAELHEEEFDEVLSNLVQEASAIYEDRISQEFGESKVQRAVAEEAVRDYLTPLVHETEDLLETIGQGVADKNLAAMSEEQLEELFEQFQPSRSDISPVFEDFLKGVWKKVKKVARGVVNLAKKGLTTIATGGLNIIWGKIKKLIKPLLNRVLRAAIGKLPLHLQPAARQLAKRLLGAGEMETVYETVYEEEEVAGVRTENVQMEFDVQIANSLLAENMEESETAIAEYQVIPEEAGDNEIDVLQDARAKFSDRITQMQKGEDVRPALEEFIPAILPALKIGIRLIGRHRVINFLSGLLSKLIDRFVGKEMAGPLSRAIVDTGLRLVAMETTEEAETRTAGNAIASTVEETVQRIARLPETVYEDLELLEAYTLEAFEQAAAANFPPEMIRPELREASVKGTWVLMPVNSRRKFYKKYTIPFDKDVTPQIISKIKTFSGQSLATVLRDQLNIDPAKSFKAKIHIYEAIPGTWLSRISRMEQNVRGLGSAAKSSWDKIHPLTPEAAAALLGEPGLGRTVPNRFLQDRDLIEVGQRFYYLEIEGVIPSRRRIIDPRSSAVYVKIDCPGNRIRVALFLSERDAQSVSSKLRQNSPWSGVARIFTSLLDSLRENFTLKRNIEIVHETVALEDYAGVLSAVVRGAGRIASGSLGKAKGLARKGSKFVIDGIGAVIAEKIINWCLKKVSEYLRENRLGFIKATESPLDGVTILITFANPGLLPIICRALRGEPIDLTPLHIPLGIPSAQVKIFAGLRRD